MKEIIRFPIDKGTSATLVRRHRQRARVEKAEVTVAAARRRLTLFPEHWRDAALFVFIPFTRVTTSRLGKSH